MKLPSLWLTICILAATGCANWDASHEPTSQPFSLAKSRLAPRSVGLEVAVAQLEEGQADELRAFLESLDLQKLPLDTRKQLDRNGLTCGIMSSRAPGVFHELTKPFFQTPEEVDIAARPLALAGRLDPVSRLLLHQRVSNKDGEAYPVGTSSKYADLTWVVHQANARSTGAVDQARCFFDVTTFPNSDGSANLTLVPVIRHGKELPRIDVSGGSFIMDRGQQRTRLDEIGFEVQLRTGQTLVIAAHSPFSHQESEETLIGPLLLGSERSDETRLLLVRLIQTQMDDLFDRSLR